MLIEVIVEEARWDHTDLKAWAETASQATLSFLKYDPADFEISLLACDDIRIAALNTDFRGKPTATNILSWPTEDRLADEAGTPPQPAVPGFLGDLALSYETCMAEADAQTKTLGDHVTHLIVHGVLHLLGYDHENDADATLMEGLETSILAELGISDPYKEADL
jgi:probable rRNA maturation factor